MRKRELLRMRRRMELDAEMHHFRYAGKRKDPTSGLLRAVRHALEIPAAEIAEKMGVCSTSLFEMENREMNSTISLRSMSRMAAAMGCKVVYGIVPRGGKTLQQLAEEQLWARVLGVGKSE